MRRKRIFEIISFELFKYIQLPNKIEKFKSIFYKVEGIKRICETILQHHINTVKEIININNNQVGNITKKGNFILYYEVLVSKQNIFRSRSTYALQVKDEKIMSVSLTLKSHNYAERGK